MKVKIKSCSDGESWYNSEIGKRKEEKNIFR